MKNLTNPKLIKYYVKLKGIKSGNQCLAVNMGVKKSTLV